MLVLTGERRHGLFLIRVRDRDVWLQERLFLSTCQLAHARKHTVSGYVRVDRRLVSLLRGAIDVQTGQEDLGHELIQTGNYRDYRLCQEAAGFVTEPSFVDSTIADEVTVYGYRCKLYPPDTTSCGCDATTNTRCGSVNRDLNYGCTEEDGVGFGCRLYTSGVACNGPLQVCKKAGCQDCQDDPDGERCEGNPWNCQTL